MKDSVKANREKVFEACDQLFAAGDRITMPAVRNRLGGGSQNSIHRYVREWEAHHRKRFLELERLSQRPPAAEVPPELWRVLVPIWEHLVAAAKAVGLAEARQERERSSGKRSTRKG